MKRAVKRLVRRLFRVASSETPADARKPPRPDKKKVWRITQRAPQGEWVDPVEAASATLDRSPQHGSPRSWNASSLDLLHGADVVEFSQDTMPSAFYDQDFESDGPKPPKKRS